MKTVKKIRTLMVFAAIPILAVGIPACLLSVVSFFLMPVAIGQLALITNLFGFMLVFSGVIILAAGVFSIAMSCIAMRQIEEGNLSKYRGHNIAAALVLLLLTVFDPIFWSVVFVIYPVPCALYIIFLVAVSIYAIKESYSQEIADFAMAQQRVQAEKAAATAAAASTATPSGTGPVYSNQDNNRLNP